MVTQEYVREMLVYNPDTGVFTWRNARPHVKAGSLAGTRPSPKRRYLHIKLGAKFYLAHRLAWLYVHGQWPEQYIDHINGDKQDNRLANLRPASPSQNQQNQKRPQGGNIYLGVIKNPNCSTWRAELVVDGKLAFRGFYQTPEEASDAYVKAKRELHPYSTL